MVVRMVAVAMTVIVCSSHGSMLVGLAQTGRTACHKVVTKSPIPLWCKGVTPHSTRAARAVEDV
jgi:hypothetical protein